MAGAAGLVARLGRRLPLSRVLALAGRVRARLLAPAIVRLAHAHPDAVVPFIVLTSHRTGSNLLVSLLADHPRVHATGEVLSRHVPLALVCPEARSWERLTPARLLHRRVFGRPGVAAAGCKVFYHHGAGFSRSAWAYLAALPDLRVVHLRRRDRLARYVSYLRAMQDGAWLRADGDASTAPQEPVVVDPAGFVAHATMWEQRRRAALERLGGSAVLEVWYEDLVADREATMAAVFSHLGVAPAPVRSSLQRQRTTPLEDVVVEHDGVVAAIADLRWEPTAAD